MTGDLPPVAPIPVTDACVVQAAEDLGVPLAAVAAILYVEGGHPGHVRSNDNGTLDVGPMQINSRWWPRFARYGIDPWTLRYDGCVNVIAGAWILRYEMERADSLREALGNYHSHTPKHHNRYVRALKRFFRRGLTLDRVVRKINGGA